MITPESQIHTLLTTGINGDDRDQGCGYTIKGWVNPSSDTGVVVYRLKNAYQ